MRVEREAERRGSTAVVLSTLLSLVVVVAAIAVVAWLVLRTPSQAVDSAERLDPVGTALPAPTDPPELPTLVPTTESESEPEPEPTALGFTGEAPAAPVAPETPEAADLPTQTVPESESAPEAPVGPTPTPRVIAQPTEPPPTPVPPTSVPPTLPPSVPVTQVPVVALEPVESAPPPTAAPVATREIQPSEPTPVPPDDDGDDDPFNIFDDDPRSSIVDVQDDPLARVRDMQDDLDNGRPITVPTRAPGDERRRDNADDSVGQVIDIPDIAVPDPDRPTRDVDVDDEPPRVITSGNDPYEIVMPDVDAMIDEITARATDPNRNPNVRDGRRITDRSDDDQRDEDVDDEDDEDDEDLSPAERRRKRLRDLIRERAGRGNNDSDSRVIMPGGGSDDGPCMDPTAPGFPFDC